MKRIFFICLIIAVQFNVFAQTENNSISAKIDSLFSEFNSFDSPGAAVVITRNDKIIFQKEYGSANLEYGVPINSNTVFHIGSVSKQFTAFAILLLEEKNKISLNDDIRKYLPELPDFGDTIHIRHLLHHTSGLREIETLLQICGISTADQIDGRQIMSLLLMQRKLNFKPGDEIEYCNTGYFLLARIVERVTGEPFPQWTKENIFVPLGMNDSRFYNDCTEIVKNRAYPYWIPGEDNKLVKGILSYSYAGPTSVFTTSTDIAKWLINFSNKKIGGEKIINKMLNETDTLNNGEVLDYGYGVGVTTHNGSKVILHSGQDAGYRAADLYYPDSKIGIAILSNFYSINPMSYGFKISDLFLENKTKANIEESIQNAGQENDNKEPEHYSPASGELKDYEGKYFCDELETQYTLIIDKDKLTAKHWRNEDTKLTAVSPGCFEGNQSWFQTIDFIRDNYNNILGFNLTSGRARNLFFRKM